MTQLPANYSYTEQDFESLVARLDQLVNSVRPDVDLTSPTLFNLLKELMAWVGDVLAFNMDNNMLEANLPTARLRKSVLAHAARLAFLPPGRSAATVDLVLTLPNGPAAADVQIPAGQVVSTEDPSPVTYQIPGGATITMGQTEREVAAENSSPVTERFTSSGLPNQSITLSGTPYVDDSLIIVAQNDVYEHANRDGLKVTNFFDSGPADAHFVTVIDESDRVTCRFGNGQNGAIPVGDIMAMYRIGGGAAGRVGPGTLTVIEGPFFDDLGNPVIVTVTNPEQSSGGDDAMSVAEIKVQAPRSVRVSDRTVAYEDYIIGAEAIPGVARALLLTSDQFPGMPENTGYLYIVPKDGGLPSSILKAAVYQAVTATKPKTVTFRVEVKDPIYTDVNVDVTVFRYSTFTHAQVAANIRTALTNLFSILNTDGTVNRRVNFGSLGTNTDGSPIAEIPLLGDVLREIIGTTTGVRKIGAQDQSLLINGLHNDMALTIFQYPRLGTITVRDGETGAVA